MLIDKYLGGVQDISISLFELLDVKSTLLFGRTKILHLV